MKTKMKTLQKEKKDLKAYNEILQDRLCAVIEILNKLLPNSKNISPEVPRLSLRDYKDYLLLVSYMTEKKIKSVTTYTITKYILKNYDYISLESTLLNLEKMGLIRIETDNKYISVFCAEKTKFEQQKIINKKRGMRNASF